MNCSETIRVGLVCLALCLRSALEDLSAMEKPKPEPKGKGAVTLAPLSPDGVPLLAKSKNPDPTKLPSLGVWDDEKLSPGRKLTMVSAAFPNVPGFVCDSWCYEAGLPFLGARALDRGRIELRHEVPGSPGVTVVTTVTPEPGAVEFLARVEGNAGAELPANPPWLNLCWQVRRATGFASDPDPYPEFVRRCFFFTSQGRTFLDRTVRRPIPSRSTEDRYNRPPWVQEYLREGREFPSAEAQAKSWAGYSSDRYTVPVIGVVSRDGKYLAALANGSASGMAQAWHDCLHNNGEWRPRGGPGAPRVWRLKVYAMANDPAQLLSRVTQEFPELATPRADACALISRHDDTVSATVAHQE